MVELKTDAALDAMREAGRVVAHALAAAREAAAVGTRLTELDEVAHDVLRKAGARSPFLHYHPSFAPTPFPAVICASVNDVIVHGIPDACRLRDGDLVSIDCGAELDGWTGDAAVSFTVGHADAADLLLIETAEKALAAGVAAAATTSRWRPTGGRCAPWTAAGPRTPSTPSPSPAAGPASSPCPEPPARDPPGRAGVDALVHDLGVGRGRRGLGVPDRDLDLDHLVDVGGRHARAVHGPPAAGS